VSTHQCFFFLGHFCLYLEWRSFIGTWKMYKKCQSSLRRFSQIWRQTTNNAQNFNDPSLCLAIQWKPHVWIWQLFEFFSLSLLGTENMQKHFFSFFFFLFFHFTFWRDMSGTQRLVISRQTLTSSAFLYWHTVKCNILQCPLAPILRSWAPLSCPSVQHTHKIMEHSSFHLS
jgi:hypothetical protein